MREERKDTDAPCHDLGAPKEEAEKGEKQKDRTLLIRPSYDDGDDDRRLKVRPFALMKTPHPREKIGKE